MPCFLFSIEKCISSYISCNTDKFFVVQLQAHNKWTNVNKNTILDFILIDNPSFLAIYTGYCSMEDCKHLNSLISILRDGIVMRKLMETSMFVCVVWRKEHSTRKCCSSSQNFHAKFFSAEYVIFIPFVESLVGHWWSCKSSLKEAQLPFSINFCLPFCWHTNDNSISTFHGVNFRLVYFFFFLFSLNFCSGWGLLWSFWNRCLYSCWICGFESLWWSTVR